MDEVKIWILIAVVSVLATILGYMLRTVTDQVIKRLDAIVAELKQLTQTTTRQEQQIKNLQEQQHFALRTLNEHASRLQQLEARPR